MSKVVSSILPVAGAVLGAIGAPFTGGLSLAAGAALGGGLGGLGGSLLSGSNPFMGAGLGALSGYLGGGNIAGLLGSGGVGAGELGASTFLKEAVDPIEALSNAMAVTGTDTATGAAQALGFSNANAMLASANPGWLSTPAAAQGLANNTTNGLIGGGANIGSFNGTVGSAPGAGIAGALRGNPATAGVAGGASGLGTLSSLLALGSGAYGLSNAAEMRKLAEQASASTQYAPQYAQQLHDLVSNPSSLTSTPGYEAGMQAVQRSLAAQGYQGSGNMAAALSKYGGDFYNQQVAQLNQLANPALAGTALSGNALAMQAANSALQGIGAGVTGLGF